MKITEVPFQEKKALGEKAAMLQKQLHEVDDEKSDLQKQVERLQKERHALKKALDKVFNFHQILRHRCIWIK